MAREQTVRALILSAGKSTRLGGKQKLLVTAGGIPVHEWHRRALTDYKTAVVVRPEDDAEVAAALTWADRIVPHGKTNGPVGAIAAYLRLFDDDTELLVVYADTLIPAQPLPPGDWVGVSRLTDRTWDHQNKYGVWVKEELPTMVAVGLYRFADLQELRRVMDEVGDKDDHHLPDLLNLYQARVYTTQVPITGWHDAGDPAALARVPQVL